GRRRQVMTPGRYTELFFLDEATGLAAGHRPCAECQRARYTAFRDAWARGNPGQAITSPVTASGLDVILHGERHPPRPQRGTYEEELGRVPAGAMVVLDAEPFLVQPGRLLPWAPEGYGAAITRPADARVAVLTPRSVVNALAQGYPVGIHASAT